MHGDKGMLVPVYLMFLLDLDQLHGFTGDVFRADFELLDEFPRRARISKTILHADGPSDHRLSHQHWAFRNDVADPPCQRADLVFFRSHHHPRLFRRPNDGGLIDRL